MITGLLEWAGPGFAVLTLAVIGYLSWRRSRPRNPDPSTLPPMSAEWRQSKDRPR